MYVILSRLIRNCTAYNSYTYCNLDHAVRSSGLFCITTVPENIDYGCASVWIYISGGTYQIIFWPHAFSIFGGVGFSGENVKSCLNVHSCNPVSEFCSLPILTFLQQ